MLMKEFTYRDYAEVRYGEGRVEGKTEGERTKALSIAQGLLSTNLTTEEIAKVTGLTRKEIENLRNLN